MGYQLHASYNEASKTVFGGAIGGIIGILFVNGQNKVTAAIVALFYFSMAFAFFYALNRGGDIAEKLADFASDEEQNFADSTFVPNVEPHNHSENIDHPRRRPGSGAS